MKQKNRNAGPVTIIADDREQKSGVVDSLREINNVHIIVKRLSVGDYLAQHRLLFERKTLKDFAVSLVDGRLFKQTIRLANTNYKSILILEGTGKDLIETSVRREAIQGALINISLILGIPVLRSINPHETARLMVYALQQLESIAKSPLQRGGYRPRGKRKRQLYLLQGLPGIGNQRAGRLLDTFGSVEAVITASGEDLQSIDGIGQNIAKKIRWLVREPVQPYGNCDELSI